jgi:hypothetical protein
VKVAIAVAQFYLIRMLQRTLPAGFIAPCLPTKTDKLPSGSQWLHEIKHDGFRIIARKNGERVRLYSRVARSQRVRALVVRSVITSQQPIAAVCPCINLMQAASLSATRTAITAAEVFEMQDKDPRTLRVAGELVPRL